MWWMLLGAMHRSWTRQAKGRVRCWPLMQLFGDESGNPGDFTDRPDDRYFMVVTVTTPDPGWLAELVALGARLRHERGAVSIGAPFHATNDRHEVRSEVYALLAQQTLRR